MQLRQLIHSHAELSGQEKETNRLLNEWIRTTDPDYHIEKLGGYGLAALYKGRQVGKRVLIRGDIDALRILESDEIPYRSLREGVSHKCGHDGHAAILCGLAQRLARRRPERGEVVLLFQPAEETGQGADAVIKDCRFKNIMPDTAYALHNLPGFEKKEIVIRKGCFAAASSGLILRFNGKTAHASQPETGKSPSPLLSLLISRLEHKRMELKEIKPLTTFVITHAVLGEETFGVAPGYAEIWLTLRSFNDNNMEKLFNDVITLCKTEAEKYMLEFSFTVHETFDSTCNTDDNVTIIERAAMNLGLSIRHLDEPFRWSEDFGRFGTLFPIGFFGLGSGLKQPALHSPEYDFPDDIIKTGVDMFEEIIREETKN